MTTTGIRTFDHALDTSREWLKDLREEMELLNDDEALVVFRAVLHTVRDRLRAEEASDLAAQLPMFLQGVYYHEWTPTGKPVKMRHKEEFLDAISEKLMGDYDPSEAMESVFAVLGRRMSEGELKDVRDNMPEDIRELWSD